MLYKDKGEKKFKVAFYLLNITLYIVRECLVNQGQATEMDMKVF